MADDMEDKNEAYWQAKLTPAQYAVLREGDTEPPFAGEYVDNEDPGMYKCTACGQELFNAETKFHSDSGWPSFWQAVDPHKIELVDDDSHGMHRIEVKCAHCGSHLGHVFPDGPVEHGGQRFCINSAALEFDKQK